MAPTETLAEQHFITLDELCAPLGVRVSLLTSALRAREHAAVRQLVASGDATIVVGTHALIQKEVDFHDLAVAVVDEQHRFGVGQRSALVEGRSPHVLHLTATPIPRTLALTVYGDLDVSELTLPPADRKPVVTGWVTEERSSEAYTRLRRHLDEGRQAYVVCPLIEESATIVARAAEAEAERLRGAELEGYRVGCLHGRLKTAERRSVMAAFKAGELDVLVATTVIEVGVDVPNATIMIVQEADRFGLAQLHQLRGRVGRGADQSYCLLVSRSRDELTEGAAERLEAMVETTDGFELAERDLEIRGEGQLLGARQSGFSDLSSSGCAGTRPCSSAHARREARDEAARGRGRPLLGGRVWTVLTSVRQSTSDESALARTLVHDAINSRDVVVCASAVRPAARRIVAGSRKGHADRGAEGRGHAPYGDRVREAAFALVGPVDGATVLDVFAGSGAMGLEALSRGATRCVFVERDRAACRVIERNLEKLRLTGAVVLCQDARRALREERARTHRYDLLLVDAPYEDWERQQASLGELFADLVTDDGLVVVETSSRVEPELPLALVTTRRYGSARITVFSK